MIGHLLAANLDLDRICARASIVSWVVLMVCLMPALWRIVRHRSQMFDPVWGIVFLLACNRLSFLFHVSLELSHITAAILALTMACFAIGYQRTDSR